MLVLEIEIIYGVLEKSNVNEEAKFIIRKEITYLIVAT